MFEYVKNHKKYHDMPRKNREKYPKLTKIIFVVKRIDKNNLCVYTKNMKINIAIFKSTKIIYTKG